MTLALWPKWERTHSFRSRLPNGVAASSATHRLSASAKDQRPWRPEIRHGIRAADQLRLGLLDRQRELHGLGDALVFSGLLHLFSVRTLKGFQGAHVLSLKLAGPCGLGRCLGGLLRRRCFSSCPNIFFETPRHRPRALRRRSGFQVQGARRRRRRGARTCRWNNVSPACRETFPPQKRRDLVELLADLGAFHAEDRAIEINVFAPT